MASANRLSTRPGDPARDEVTLSGNISRSDAVALAVRRNRQLQSMRLELDKADARSWQSYATVLPNISLGGNYSRVSRVMSFDLGGQTMAMGAPDNYSVSATAYQPLFHGGASLSALNSATLMTVMSEAHIRKASQDVVMGVSKAYYDVALAGQLLTVCEETLESASGHLADVERRKQQGMASEFDMLRAQVEVANASAELVRQRNSLNLTRAALLNMLGASQNSNFTLTDAPDFVETKPNLEDAVVSAFTNRSDLVQAELAVRLNQEALRTAVSARWPQADAFFTYNNSKPDSLSVGDTGWGDSWTAGITVNVPLFDGFLRHGKVKEAEAALKQSRIQLAAAEEQVLLEVKQAILSLADADEMVKALAATIQQAAEGLRMAENGYKAGILTALQVTDARTALARARAFHYQAVYAHAIARLNLMHATGTLHPDDTGISTQEAE